ncbi:MAG TPA: DUF192 domain-containing protein [Arenimonas sp.]|nr:DUF192 domain-containing protein [Arenimonas sp.]
MRKRLSAALLLNLTFIAGGCAQTADKPWAEVNGRRFSIEVADTDALRERGLMFRRDLADDQGMLFIHDDASPIAYWMKNTYIPLDILYFDERKKLVSAQLNVPPCGEQAQCPIYPSAGPAMYVLEINAGLAGQLKLKPGDALTSSAIASGE